ncbi:hypothetical protein EON63_16440 [archaeon]|nr:MAG: hypothetical protein EON63_16440 [archaeon]
MIKKASSSPKGSNSPPKDPSGAVHRERSIHEPDKIKVFVTSWNMGNAEAMGMKNIFDEQRATEKFDIFAIGLQESTYKCDTDSIQHLAKQITEFLGPNFFLVSIILSIFMCVRGLLRKIPICFHLSPHTFYFMHVT